MPAVEEIRRKIKEVLDARGVGSINFAKDLGIERNYISDFLKGRKRSLSIEVATAVAEKLDIPLKDLTPHKERPLPVIRKGRRPHLYITEHMESRGFDDEAMSRRMDGISPDVVAKWRRSSETMQPWQVAAVLHALDLEDEADLAKLPPPPIRDERVPAKPVRKRA